MELKGDADVLKKDDPTIMATKTTPRQPSVDQGGRGQIDDPLRRQLPAAGAADLPEARGSTRRKQFALSRPLGAGPDRRVDAGRTREAA